MRKRIVRSIVLLILFFNCYGLVNATTCDLGVNGWINGTWTVPTNCTFPTGPHLINGDIIVGDNVLTVPSDSMIVIDLMTKKMTFDLGKILFVGNAVVKYVWTEAFLINSGTTAGETLCPAGQFVINPTTLEKLTVGTDLYVGTEGRFYCQ